MKVTVLGCGASSGVPVIGCDCTICTSANPKNRRTRVSILLESEHTKILVDTPPDMREQVLRNRIKTVSAVIYTHAHADHIGGIDDTRSFNYYNNAPLDIYSNRETLDEIQQRYPYMFQQPTENRALWYKPSLNPILFEPPQVYMIGDIEIRPFWQMHGQSRTLGLRIGNFAYTTDTNGFPEDTLSMLKGIDVWLVDCLRYKPASTHAHLNMSLGWIEQMKPKQAYLTHMNHELDYDVLAKELPKHVMPAYDGLVINV